MMVRKAALLTTLACSLAATFAYAQGPREFIPSPNYPGGLGVPNGQALPPPGQGTFTWPSNGPTSPWIGGPGVLPKTGLEKSPFHDPRFALPKLPQDTVPGCKPMQLTLVIRSHTISDQFGTLNVNQQGNFFQFLNTRDTRTGGGISLQVDTELLPSVVMTTSGDFAWFGDEDSAEVGDGLHTAISIQFHVDPVIDNVFYGVGIDIYVQPPIDPFDTGGFSPIVAGQIRGGAGVSTCYGDFIFRGGSRTARDIDLSMPLFGGLFPGPRFNTRHIEGGIQTLIGPLELGLFFGQKVGPFKQEYIFIDWRLPLPLKAIPTIVGEFYMDNEDNLGLSAGIAFGIRKGPALDQRRMMRPMTVARANRMSMRPPTTFPP